MATTSDEKAALRPPVIHPAARQPRPEDRAALVRALALVVIRAAVVPSEPPAAEPYERAA